MTWAALPGRNLDRRELAELVNRLADDPALWQPHVAFSDEHRHYVSLRRDDHVDVWLLCWTESNDTGWHDHDVSSGAVRVVRGALRESNPRIGGDHLTYLMELQIVAIHGAPGDHPWAIRVPEGRYLKAVYSRVMPLR